ncbi:MAG: DEAD/DEAH box helicase [Alphaproteobacteria bacterium]|nr:DEAD/DEAH box helicase [Alphaproteobacteria bacterium]
MPPRWRGCGRCWRSDAPDHPPATLLAAADGFCPGHGRAPRYQGPVTPDPTLAAFGPATRDWFARAFPEPTPVQRQGWDCIASGAHTLMLAPTGSGKTLAAFLYCLDRLAHRPVEPDRGAGVRVLYVSPMKALVYDVERNLRTPLAGISAAGRRLDLPLSAVSVDVRTGDTPSQDRRRFQRQPGDVLVTTPESLYLLLSSRARGCLAAVDTVIVDEIHAVAGSKRGVHLALSLERLQELVTRPDPVTGVRRPAPQRIGLSATQRPLSEIAAFLGGADPSGQPRPVALVDCSARPDVDLQVVVPVDDMEHPVVDPTPHSGAPAPPWAGIDPVADDLPAVPADSSLSNDKTGIWPAIHPRLLELITSHRASIVFTNSRRMCERLSQRLNELAAEAGLPVPLVRAHHGSVSHAERTEIEEQMKAGQLPCIVATSSLELGIDMGAIDLVVLIESPGAASRGLQRVGRAGHQVGATSRGRIFPKYRGDLLETAVVVQMMEDGEIEETQVPRNCLDVLAQHVVSACLEGEREVDALLAMVRSAWPFRDLGEGAWTATLDMLAGSFPGDDLGEIRPRVVWDRSRDVLRARGDARLAVFSTPGTIPDRGLYGVYLADAGGGEGERRQARGRRLGELDEEMVYESRKGDTIILGATTWRIVDIQRDRVLVQPAPGEPGRMPFWRGEGPGRPIGLGRALGAFVRKVDAMERDDAVAWLTGHCRLDDRAASNLLAYLADQREATGALPSDRAITIERFRDELGDWRVCILTPFGARVHAPWALALEATLGDRTGDDGADTGVQAMWTDDGIVLRFPDVDLLSLDGEGGRLPDQALLLPDPDLVEDLVTEQLRHSAVFAARFREAAVRALLMNRRRPGQRSPLWAQRLSAQRLLAAASRHPGFPIVLETYRECLQDVFDLPALVEVLREIHARRVRVDEVETDVPSPFARDLVFAYVAEFLYEGDAPLAERRAQALALDRGLLRELLGEDELRDLLDADVIAQVEAELQGTDEARRARSVDALHDLLRRVGGLSLAELAARVRADDEPADDVAARWLDELVGERRVVRLRIAGDERYVAVQDVARYRDGLGVVPPAGVPSALLLPVDDALTALVRRYAATHGPFRAPDLATRLGLAPGQLAPVLQLLLAHGALVRGALRPGGRGEQDWCDAEILRRIKRRTLARLRGEVAPVDGAALARFSSTWQGVVPLQGSRRGDPAALLEDAVLQLEGAALPFSVLEERILPARVPGYRPEMLDRLGASGAIVWVGCGRLGARDGRIALVRRELAPQLVAVPPADLDARSALVGSWTPLHGVLLDHLEHRGASFSVELQQAVVAAAERLDGRVGATELQQALWDLVFAGLVTNDTFHPLRGLGGPRRGTSRSQRSLGGRSAVRALDDGRRRGRLGGGLGGAGGRWSAVSWLVGEGSDPTRTAHARAVMLLERYGVVGAGHARGEDLPGGFSAVYDVLRSMEESGRVRRGHFVTGLDGAQFALVGAVDRLRACRAEPQPGDDPRATGAGPLVLAATDPAAPWGLSLPWPPGLGDAQARRVAGALVVAVSGEPVLFVEAGGRSAVSFAGVLERERAQAAVDVLREDLGRRRQASLRIERLDGGPAAHAQAAPVLLQAGLLEDGEGLRLPAPL